MTDTLRAAAKALLSFTYTKDLTLRDPEDPVAIRLESTLEYGTGAGQGDKVWASARTLAGGANEVLDLKGSATDENGNTLAFSKIKFLLIYNDGTVAITVGGAGSNPWEGAAALLKAAGGTLHIPAGAFILVACGEDDAAGFTVTNSSADNLKVLNEDGSATASYQIGIVGVA